MAAPIIAKSKSKTSRSMYFGWHQLSRDDTLL